MKLKKSLSKLVCLFICLISTILLSCQNVNAQFYEAEKNTVVGFSSDRTANKLSVTIQYQNGLSDLEVYICPVSVNKILCTTDENYYKSQFILPELNNGEFIVNDTEEIKTKTIVFNNATNGLDLNQYVDETDSSGKVNNTYTMMVKTKFCIVRSDDAKRCNTWSEDIILERTFELNKSVTNSGEINKTIATMLNIINNIVIPILWILLGVLLIVRGIMLGMDIVKSADEPEVRKKKVSGLVWLFIGIGVGYLVTILASVIMSMFGFGGYF